MAGELLRAAVRADRPLSVLVMTNGDLSCARDGHVRQAETISALAALGVTEDSVYFLGYPDGWLDALGPVPLDPLPRTQPDGACGTGDQTYASRGMGAADLHTTRTGEAGAYVADGPVDDLAWLLLRERPTEIVTAHGIDTHPDHAMTYVYVRRAIERAAIEAPLILRSLVHQGPCWPNGGGAPPCPDVRTTRGSPFPALAAPLADYAPGLRVASDDLGSTKRDAIARYVSQLETAIADESWLSSFARADEVFWPERPEVDPDAATRVVLEGSAGTAAITDEVTLVVDEGGVTLRDGERTLGQLPIPHGEAASDTHRYEVLVDRRPVEGPFVELTVRRDGVLWMSGLTRARTPETGATRDPR